jgi:hypothetical protein
MALYREEPISSARGVRATNDLALRLGDGLYRVDGTDLRVPMRIEECSVIVNTFWVERAAAQRLMGDAPLETSTLLPGRTLVILLGVQYTKNPLGNYGEAAVLVPVGVSGGKKPRMPFGGLLSMLTGSATHLVYRMPVDQEFTAHAGRFLWGYPKYLAKIDVAFGTDEATARLSENGEPVFALRAPASESGRLSERPGNTLTVRNGVTRVIEGSIGGTGVAFRLGGAAPEIGSAHPLAAELRSLGLPKTPFATASIRHAHMSFGEARELARSAAPARPDEPGPPATTSSDTR